MKPTAGKIRIISGLYRSRVLKFTSSPDLRPTPNRLRESLFNWLREDIIDLTCLDLFAGSAALAIEALSRGAEHAVIVEQNKQSFLDIKANITHLNIKNVTVFKLDALRYLDQCDEEFDLIFLDPPYKIKILESTMNLIESKRLINNQGWCYFEQPSHQALAKLPQHWSIIKSSVAGEAIGALCKISRN